MHLRTRRRAILFVTLSLAALAVYVPRTYRALAVMGDSAELVTAAAQWGVPHPPGYPLYTWLAHLATRFPAFELPFRVHVTSACFHAMTVGVVGCIIELVTTSTFAALLGALLLLLSRIFFLGSLYAEVFPLNDMLFACLLLLAIMLADADGVDASDLGEPRAGEPLDRREDERGRSSATARNQTSTGTIETRRWAIFAVILGLALAHHQMIVLAFPALASLVASPLRRRAREYPRWTAALVLVTVLVPVACYALIPLATSRDPNPSWGDVRDGASLFRLVTREDYGGLLHASRRAADGQLLARFDALFAGTAKSFGVVGFVLLFAGAVLGLRRARRTTIALLLAVFCAGPLFAAMNAFDIHSDYRIYFFERFLSMCHVSCAVVMGIGAAELERWLREEPRLPARARHATTTLALGLATAPLLGNLSALDFHDDVWGSAYARDLVESTPDGALVLLKSDMASQASLFACAVARQCGNRVVLTPGQLWMPWKRRQFARRFPEIALPPDGASPARWLVEQNVTARPVFVHPELVDDVVRGDLAALPSTLLFRVYPSEQALRADLPQLRDAIADIIAGRRCAGCALAKAPRPRSPADDELARIYDQAMHAEVTAATELGLEADAKRLSSWRAEP